MNVFLPVPAEPDGVYSRPESRFDSLSERVDVIAVEASSVEVDLSLDAPEVTN